VGICNIHGSCVLLAGAATAFGAPEDAGLLLLGESGAGKSDLALRLIERGAMLVADDRVELSVRYGQLIGRAPENLAGLIEVRRVGIIRVLHAVEATICLVITLDPPMLSPDGASKPRLPDAARYAPPGQLDLQECAWPPLLSLAAFENSAPAKAVAAAAAFAHARFHNQRGVP
jgi:HPr kinase/phosphorylase